jgi:chromosome segregation ATPase
MEGLRTEAGAGRREADSSRQQLDDMNAEVLSLLKQRGELEQENASIRLDLETLDEESQLAQATIEELGLKKDALKADLRAARDKVEPPSSQFKAYHSSDVNRGLVGHECLLYVSDGRVGTVYVFRF